MFKESVWNRYAGYAGVDLDQLSGSVEREKLEEAEIARIASVGLRVATERYKVAGTPKYPDVEDVTAVMSAIGLEVTPEVREVAQIVINDSVELVTAN
jgi:hypothetical protein